MMQPEQLAAFYSVAQEGAQVRAIAELVSGGELGFSRPRSITVITTDDIARCAVTLAAAHRSPLCVPISCVAASGVTEAHSLLPRYIGALDIVVVVGSAGEHWGASYALSQAASRGATCCVIGPTEGPLVDDAPAQTIIAPAPLALGGEHVASPLRMCAGFGALVDLLVEDGEVVRSRLMELADVIDNDLEALAPDHDALTNPARQIAEYCAGYHVLHTNAGPGGSSAMVAKVVSRLWLGRGILSSSVVAEEFPWEKLPTPDLFHDPFLDEPSEMIPWKVVAWAAQTQPDRWPNHHGPNALVQRIDAVDQGLGPASTQLRLVVRGLAAAAYMQESAVS